MSSPSSAAAAAAAIGAAKTVEVLTVGAAAETDFSCHCITKENTDIIHVHHLLDFVMLLASLDKLHIICCKMIQINIINIYGITFYKAIPYMIFRITEILCCLTLLTEYPGEKN